jgi:rRNA-processing protein FCF1
MITQCCMRHLYATKDQSIIESAKQFERKRCGHHDLEQPLSALECLESCVDPKGTGVNSHRYVVAAQEPEIRSKMRSIPGVPLIYITRSVVLLEPMSGVSTDTRERAERVKFRDGIRGTRKRKRDEQEDTVVGEEVPGRARQEDTLVGEEVPGQARPDQEGPQVRKKENGPRGQRGRTHLVLRSQRKGRMNNSRKILWKGSYEFEAILSDDRKVSFRTKRSQARESPPDSNDVMCLTAEIDRSVSRKARRCFGPRLTNMFLPVQQFASLGGIWSLARMTLLVGTPILASSWWIVNNLLLTDDISICVLPGKAITSIYEYWTFCAMIPRSKNPQAYLCEQFIVIVRLCHQTKKKSTLAPVSYIIANAVFVTFHSQLKSWAGYINFPWLLYINEFMKKCFIVIS